MRTVFVDPQRCIGCLQCEFACAVAHSKTRDPVMAFAEIARARDGASTSRRDPVRNTAYPNKCQHCDPAPCMGVCPSGAIYARRRRRTRADRHREVHRLRDVRDGLPVRRHHLSPQVVRRATSRGRSPSSATAASTACARAGSRPASRPARPAPCGSGTINEFIAADQRRETGRVLAGSGRSGAEPTPDAASRRGGPRGATWPIRRCAMTLLDRNGYERRPPPI